MELSQEAMEILMNHQWPGNIRELQHTIERGIIMADGEIIKPVDIGLISESLISPSKDYINNLNLKEVEKLMVGKALKKHSGNITKAAHELGLTRAALYRRMEKHDL